MKQNLSQYPSRNLPQNTISTRSKSPMPVPVRVPRPRLTTSLASLLLFSLLCPVAQAQTAAETFAKARRTEINQAQARQALPLYELVAQSPSATDTLKARALYRLSICYLKLEEYKKASDTLTRLETSYPRSDQAVQARLLRKTLGASQKALQPRRDVSFEVQKLLLDGTKGRNNRAVAEAWQVALRGIQFFGKEATPILRKSLHHGDLRIRTLALNALVQRGDESAFDGLMELTGTDQWWWLDFATDLVPSDWLVDLCKRKPEVWVRVRTAFAKSQGKRKANLLLTLGRAKRLDLVPDYGTLVDDGDQDIRKGAWSVLKWEAEGDPSGSRKYMARLLSSWSKRSGVVDSDVVYQMADACVYAMQAGEPLLSQWTMALTEDLREKTPVLADRLTEKKFSRDQDLLLPLRIVALSSSFKAFQLEAISYRPRKGVIDSPADLAQIVDLGLPLSQTWLDKDPKHAVALLAYTLDTARSLPLQEWKKFMSHLVKKEILSPYLEIEDTAQLKVVQQSLGQAFSASPYRQERRLPFLMTILGSSQPSVIQLAALDALYSLVAQGEGIPGHATGTLKPILFQLQDQGFEENGLGRLCKDRVNRLFWHLLGVRKGLTLKEALIRVDFHFQPRDPNFSVLMDRARGGRSHLELIQSLAKVPSVRIYGLLECIHESPLRGEQKTAAYRSLWPRANSAEREEIVQSLPAVRENVPFMLEALDTKGTVKLGQTLLAWIDEYSGPEKVDLLIRALNLEHVDHKVTACQELESLADPKAAPALIDLLTFPDIRVRDAAEKALESIKNIDKNQKAWRDWYAGLKKRGK